MTMSQTELATLGAGCFWCVEALFEQLRGVELVQSGYMGGKTVNPSYEQVCTGNTGHAEVIQVTFDPAIVTYADLLNVFFTVHDPTTLNRQGADIGTQYRSAIFTHSPEQVATAAEVLAQWNAVKAWPNPIVTEIVPATEFYPAEDYHQGYFRLQGPTNGYCRAVVAPKVGKFREKFASMLKGE